MRVLLVLAAAGCTTTYVVQTAPTSAQLSGFNASLRDREVELRLADDKVRGRDLTLGAEATWTVAKGQPRRVPLKELQSVRFLSPRYAHERGALEGAAFGLLTGAAVGAAIGFASGDDTLTRHRLVLRTALFGLDPARRDPGFIGGRPVDKSHHRAW
jgi:hypothetical protein